MHGAAGTGRLDRVRVATARGTTEISWAGRSALLDRLRGAGGTFSVRRAFLAAGATRPVELGEREAWLLVDAIDDWADRLGASRLPSDIRELRDALVDALRDPGHP